MGWPDIAVVSPFFLEGFGVFWEGSSIAGGWSPGLSMHEPSTIQSARLCLRCGYNRYGLTRQGACPECGQRYRRRRSDAVAKNPRRQLATLRRMLRQEERKLRWFPLQWVVFAVIFVGLYFLDGTLGWWLIIGFAALVNVLIYWGVMHAVRHLRARIEAIDQSEGVKRASSCAARGSAHRRR